MVNKVNKINPIYFGVAVWGRPFCESFINYALASLLAEGNIPALGNPSGKNRFLIYTTAEDKRWLEKQVLLKFLENFMQVEFIEITPISEDEYQKLNNALGSSKLYTMTAGHRLILSRMYADKAVGSIVIADSIYSNKSIFAAYQHIIGGKTAVLVFCPRFSTTSIVNELEEQNYIQPALPLTIESRDLIKAAIQHLHTDMRMQEWDIPYLPEFMMEAGWWLPDKSGLLFHTWTCWYAFIDYSRLTSHNMDSLGGNTIDGVYFHDNLKKEEAHLITDSDEFTLISFSPEIYRKQVHINIKYLPSQSIINYLKKAFIIQKMKGILYMQTDPFKLQFAQCPIYMHTNDLTETCLKQQIKTQAMINRVLEGKLTVFAKIALSIAEEQFNIKKISHRLAVKIMSKIKKLK